MWGKIKGCVYGKPSSAVKDSEDSLKQRELNRKASELRASRAVSRKRVESFSSKQNLESGDFEIGLIDRKVNESRKVSDDYYDKKIDNSEDTNNFPVLANIPKAVKIDNSEDTSDFPLLANLPKAVDGEHVAAGWPSWLVSVAGEAIRGWVPRKADTFEKLDKIGQGTYSCVYKGRDLLNNKFVALKKVRFDNMDPESVKFMAREIHILRKLNHPNIIKLEGLVASRSCCSLYLVFEYMEHDLTGLTSLPGVKFTEPQVKCYMQQLLRGLDHCHSNGVLHRDIKGSNLLIDNHGILKIADFGLASHFDNNQKVPLTSRVVTLWYRPPELLLGATHYGVGVDLWSAGCILGELYTKKPIMPGRTEVEQLHKIFKLCGSPPEDYWRKTKLPHSQVFKPIQPYRRRIAETFKEFPEASVRLMETLLSVDPSGRATASTALQAEFFETKPLACDPSSLPKYPPSKERDAKLREEEARRHGALGVKGHKGGNDSKRSKELLTTSASDANNQRRFGPVNPKSDSELFNPHKADSALCFPMDPPNDRRKNSQERVSNSGSFAPGVGWRLSGRRNNNDSSTLPGLAASRALSSVESQGNLISSRMESGNQVGSLSESFRYPVRIQDQKRQTQIFCGSQNAERMDKQDSIADGNGCKERAIYSSDPLVATSNIIEQVLKEHDRRIQEAARRLKHEKTRACRIRPQSLYL